MQASRVLVVEDSETIRVAVQTALRAQGFVVESRADGQDLETCLSKSVPTSSCST